MGGQLPDRVFVVTGGGNGIGREVVLALLGPDDLRRQQGGRQAVHRGLHDGDLEADLTARRTPPARSSRGVEKGSYRVVIGRDARVLDRLSRLAPRRATELVAKKMAALLG